MKYSLTLEGPALSLAAEDVVDAAVVFFTGLFNLSIVVICFTGVVNSTAEGRGSFIGVVGRSSMPVTWGLARRLRRVAAGILVGDFTGVKVNVEVSSFSEMLSFGLVTS